MWRDEGGRMPDCLLLLVGRRLRVKQVEREHKNRRRKELVKMSEPNVGSRDEEFLRVLNEEYECERTWCR